MSDWLEYTRSWLGLDLLPGQQAQFETYLQELLEWNSRFNLTAIREPRAIQFKHFLDSLSCVLALADFAPPNSLIDVGSGAGLPGIPLKIIFPEMSLTLVESTQKKAKFCQHALDRLALSDARVLAERAEDVGQDPSHREQYQLAVARAVAPMPTLVEYLLPLVAPGGRVIMQKGNDPAEEISASSNAIRLLGGRVREVINLALPEVEGTRSLVVLDKVRPTPLEFPRRAGLPAKTPIGR